MIVAYLSFLFDDSAASNERPIGRVDVDGNTYAETSDGTMAAQYRAVAKTVIEKNLGFLARYPQEKY